MLWITRVAGESVRIGARLTVRVLGERQRDTVGLQILRPWRDSPEVHFLRVGEHADLGGGVEIHLGSIDRSSIKLGVAAPADLTITREETA